MRVDTKNNKISLRFEDIPIGEYFIEDECYADVCSGCNEYGIYLKVDDTKCILISDTSSDAIPFEEVSAKFSDQFTLLNVEFVISVK